MRVRRHARRIESMGVVELDRDRLVRQLDATIARLPSERQRTMVAVYRDHVCAEIDGDLDKILQTLSPDPQYHGWGPEGDVGPKGAAAVRDFYAEWFALKANFFDIDIHRVVVDDVHVVSEQTQHMIISGDSFLKGRWGSSLRAAGEEQVAAFDTTGHYLLVNRSIIVVPFDDQCRMEGEDGYGGGGTMRRLDDAELPAAYRRFVVG
jgi:hypothetical protein